MQYAKCIYGVIIDAREQALEESKYEIYKKLQLRCLKCGEPVFFIGGGKRKNHTRILKSRKVVAVKEAHISPAFAHFPSLGTEECDYFVGNISQTDIVRYESKSRSQRLNLYLDFFLEMIGFKGVDRNHNFFTVFKKVNNFNNKDVCNFKKMVVEGFQKSIVFNKTKILEITIEMFSMIQDNFDQYEKKFKGKENPQFLEMLKNTDIALQRKIWSEVIDFLCSRAVQKIIPMLLEECFIGAMKIESMHRESEDFSWLKFRIPITEAETRKFEELIIKLDRGLATIIAFTDWANAIAQLNLQAKKS